MEPPNHIRRVAELWRLNVLGEVTTAELWTHPIGWELRVLWNGELQRSQAYRDPREADQDARDTYARLDGYNRERQPDG